MFEWWSERNRTLYDSEMMVQINEIYVGIDKTGER